MVLGDRDLFQQRFAQNRYWDVFLQPKNAVKLFEHHFSDFGFPIEFDEQKSKRFVYDRCRGVAGSGKMVQQAEHQLNRHCAKRLFDVARRSLENAEDAWARACENILDEIRRGQPYFREEDQALDPVV